MVGTKSLAWATNPAILESSLHGVASEMADNKLACHVALVGDSIFDNGGYVSPEPDVCSQLLELIEKVTLCAVDGATTSSVHQQLQDVPPDVNYLVLSVGGNDALQEGGVLDQAVRSVREGLAALSGMIRDFEQSYSRLMDAVIHRARIVGCKTIVCTIYDPFYVYGVEQVAISTALRLFNDVILSTALANDLPVIDLRTVCFNKEDFTHEIEPSTIGGRKIALAIRDKIKKIDSL